MVFFHYWNQVKWVKKSAFQLSLSKILTLKNKRDSFFSIEFGENPLSIYFICFDKSSIHLLLFWWYSVNQICYYDYIIIIVEKGLLMYYCLWCDCMRSSTFIYTTTISYLRRKLVSNQLTFHEMEKMSNWMLKVYIWSLIYHPWQQQQVCRLISQVIDLYFYMSV